MHRKLTTKFWEYEMGAEMMSTVDAWNHYLEEKNNKDSSEMQARWEAFQISFRYIFGFDVHFTRTEEYYGICNEDGSHFYYKVER